MTRCFGPRRLMRPASGRRRLPLPLRQQLPPRMRTLGRRTRLLRGGGSWLALRRRTARLRGRALWSGRQRSAETRRSDSRLSRRPGRARCWPKPTAWRPELAAAFGVTTSRACPRSRWSACGRCRPAKWPSCRRSARRRRRPRLRQRPRPPRWRRTPMQGTQRRPRGGSRSSGSTWPRSRLSSGPTACAGSGRSTAAVRGSMKPPTGSSPASGSLFAELQSLPCARRRWQSLPCERD
mmetsp:Transcript_1056/g.4060  ORF Transcript_1056/g.4060 Transcript_1056/m.4060 type:complete len:237 (-) Transcript_1056:144-854(-)